MLTRYQTRARLRVLGAALLVIGAGLWGLAFFAFSAPSRADYVSVERQAERTIGLAGGGAAFTAGLFCMIGVT